MIIGLIVALVILTGLLVLVTVVQTFYLESLRLRTREAASQQVFKEVLESRLGYKAESGALTFSVVKHTLLPLLGAGFVALHAIGQPLTVTGLIEGLIFALAVMLVSSYLVPHGLYRRTSCRWLLPFIPILRLCALMAWPLTAFLSALQSLSRLDTDASTPEEPTAEENIEALITAGAEEGIIEEEDRKLIQSAAAFGNKTVREVMTPRPAIVAVNAKGTLKDLRQLVISEQFSRIPVYEDTIDSIIGFVHVRDMFEMEERERAVRAVRDLVRPVSFVPETKPVDALLREMQQEGNHIAVVVDEYGNTAGLVTMEDMVEEIVGEIRDEHEPGTDVKQDERGGYIVSGSFDVDLLEDLVHYKAQTDTESTTIGGLVTEWVGHVPKVGEAVEHDGVRVEVLAGNELRVEQVRISRVEPIQNGG